MIKRNKATKHTLIENLIYFSLFFFLILCILPEELFAIFSVGFCLIYIVNKRFIFNFFNIGFLSICLINFLSSILFVLFHPNTDFVRFLASMNTILTRAVPAVLFTDKNLFKTIDKSKIIRAAKFNLIIFFLLTIFALYFMNKDQNFVIFGKTLFIKDWINGQETKRLTLFMQYASLITFFVFYNLGFLLLNSKCNIINTVYIICCFAPVYFSYSRICIVAYVIFVLFYLMHLIKLKLKKGTLIIILLIAFFLIFCLLNYNRILNLISEILNSREGSNSLRFDLYYSSFEFTVDTNLLLGCGVKVMFSTAVPYGSHNTFLGVFYKTGLLGFTIFIILYFYLLWRLLKKKNLILIGFFLSLSLIMIFEDVDGTNRQFFYLALLGNITWEIEFKKSNLKLNKIRKLTMVEVV